MSFHFTALYDIQRAFPKRGAISLKCRKSSDNCYNENFGFRCNNYLDIDDDID